MNTATADSSRHRPTALGRTALEPDQLVTVQVALDDAYAYRIGEADGLDDPDLDDVDRAACERYLALGNQLVDASRAVRF